MENLKIASEAVSGTFVAPGRRLRCWTTSPTSTTSRRTYRDGAETVDEGGGLCQVTSTLYNAALYAGMEITERTAHYSQLPYIRPGMDATVWYGGPGTVDDLDMKFKNTSDGYVLCRSMSRTTATSTPTYTVYPTKSRWRCRPSPSSRSRMPPSG